VLPLKDNIPTRRFPILTVLIIVACCVVYFGVQKGGILKGPDDKHVIEYAAIPYEVTHPGKHCGVTAIVKTDTGQTGRLQGAPIALCEGKSVTLASGASAKVERVPGSQPSTWLTLLFAMFMHGSIIHLAGNMLFLWIFGNNIEDSMSRWRFLTFYLLGGLAASAAQIAVSPGSTTPTLGASGAIAAVLGGYALLYPRARVVTLVFIIIFVTVIELPALVVLGAWFVLQLLDASSQPLGGGGVAYFAHIGGFVFGLLAIRFFANRIREDYDHINRLPVY
jgi:membrane associated rhomboid family serine protease